MFGTMGSMGTHGFSSLSHPSRLPRLLLVQFFGMLTGPLHALPSSPSCFRFLSACRFLFLQPQLDPLNKHLPASRAPTSSPLLGVLSQNRPAAPIPQLCRHAPPACSPQPQTGTGALLETAHAPWAERRAQSHFKKSPKSGAGQPGWPRAPAAVLWLVPGGNSRVWLHREHPVHLGFHFPP